MANTPEISDKLHRLGAFLDKHHLDGVLLNHRANFAWITGGKNNYIPSNSQNGVARILATRDERICFTNSIERPRFETEELAGTGIKVVDYPWYDGAAGTKALKELIGGKRIAADVDDNGNFNHMGAGLVALPVDFAELRWSLTPAEVDRYKEGGRLTSEAIEAACFRITQGMSEHEIAGVLDDEIHAKGMWPVVTLIAADERVEKYRHPIATNQKVNRYCMLVMCASHGGLISNITRFVSFTKLSDAIRKKQQQVVNVDLAVNLSTRPGKTFGEMFDVISKAYADNGHPGEYKNHHQGGSTGYAGRDAFATPGDKTKVLENQAFAWNPSIAGVKSEDTILCTGKGVEFITTMSSKWPKVSATFEGKAMDRPDILVR